MSVIDEATILHLLIITQNVMFQAQGHNTLNLPSTADRRHLQGTAALLQARKSQGFPQCKTLERSVRRPLVSHFSESSFFSIELAKESQLSPRRFVHTYSKACASLTGSKTARSMAKKVLRWNLTR